MQTGKFRGFEVTVHDTGIALLTFNQPERLNGMNHHIKRDLVETLLQAQMDDTIRLVVFTGSGRAFSAGDEISGRPMGDREHRPSCQIFLRGTTTRLAPTMDCAVCRNQ